MLDLNDVLENIPFIGDLIKNVAGLTVFNSIIGIILGIGIIALLYVIWSYTFMFRGRKAGLVNDWFAYIPVARTIYNLDIVGEDRWKMLFIGGISWVIKLVLVILLAFFAVSVNVVVAVIFEILVVAYFGVSIYFNYIFNRKMYRLFGFNEHLALVNLAGSVVRLYLIVALFGGFVTLYAFWGFATAITAIESTYDGIFVFLTAFDNRCQIAGNEINTSVAPVVANVQPNRGKMICTSGEYKDAEFQIENDFEIIIGRDSYFSSIVITQNAKSVSRKHCGIRYDSASRQYIVTDYSSNGTYTGDGHRLQRNVPQTLSPGTSLYLGDKVNRFKLM